MLCLFNYKKLVEGGVPSMEEGTGQDASPIRKLLLVTASAPHGFCGHSLSSDNKHLWRACRGLYKINFLWLKDTGGGMAMKCRAGLEPGRSPEPWLCVRPCRQAAESPWVA